MSKQRINEYLPLAYKALDACGIAKNGAVDSALRGQIAAFGAAVSLGSLLPAIAFFSERGKAASERQDLMKAIHWILLKSDGTENNEIIASPEGLFKQALGMNFDKMEAFRERILDAAVALKLAMNLYKRSTGEELKKGGEPS